MAGHDVDPYHAGPARARAFGRGIDLAANDSSFAQSGLALRSYRADVEEVFLFVDADPDLVPLRVTPRPGAGRNARSAAAR